MRRKIMRYPEQNLTQEEFDNLPQNVDGDFLNFNQIGSWFVCKPNPEIPEVIVIGQIVKGEDIFVDQYGGGILSIPRRGINRYRAIIK